MITKYDLYCPQSLRICSCSLSLRILSQELYAGLLVFHLQEEVERVLLELCRKIDVEDSGSRECYPHCLAVEDHLERSIVFQAYLFSYHFCLSTELYPAVPAFEGHVLHSSYPLPVVDAFLFLEGRTH